MAIKKPASSAGASTKSRRELMEERQKALQEKGGGPMPYFLIKDGVTRMRMPRTVEDQEFCMEVSFIFLGKDSGGGVISPTTFGEPCAITEEYQRLKASSDEDDTKLAERLKPKKRFMGPFLKYKDEKGKDIDVENGVKLALLTGGLYQEMVDLWLDEEQGDFSDPEDGYDIKFKRTGTGQFDTTYTATPCKPTPLSKAFSKTVYNPEEMIRELIPTYEETEELLAKFMGASTKDEEAEAPKKKKKPSGDLEDAPVKKKKKRPTA